MLTRDIVKSLSVYIYRDFTPEMTNLDLIKAILCFLIESESQSAMRNIVTISVTTSRQLSARKLFDEGSGKIHLNKR